MHVSGVVSTGATREGTLVSGLASLGLLLLLTINGMFRAIQASLDSEVVQHLVLEIGGPC